MIMIFKIDKKNFCLEEGAASLGTATMSSTQEQPASHAAFAVSSAAGTSTS